MNLKLALAVLVVGVVGLSVGCRKDHVLHVHRYEMMCQDDTGRAIKKYEDCPKYILTHVSGVQIMDDNRTTVIFYKKSGRISGLIKSPNGFNPRSIIGNITEERVP